MTNRYSYNYSRDIVQRFTRLYRLDVVMFSAIYSTDIMGFPIKLFRTDQVRWRRYKAVIRHIRFIRLQTHDWRSISGEKWREYLQRFVEKGFPAHMQTWEDRVEETT